MAMKAGLYQFCPSFGKKQDNLRTVASALANADADLIVLPEFFATGYQFATQEEVAALSEPVPDGETTALLSELSRERKMFIVAGLPERDGNSLYNSAVLTGPYGFMGVYRKTHLFFEEKLFFSHGETGFRVWDTDVGRIGIMICFDWFFPESMRTLALMGADIVAHPSNLVLPHCPQAMPVRCLENRVFSVTANRTGTEDRKGTEPLTFIGRSVIASPRGEVLAAAPDTADALISADIDISLARDKSLNPLNDLFRDRRPDMYGRLCRPEEKE